MRPASRLRFAVIAVVLALAGVWITHTLEMLRVFGGNALGQAWGRPVHAYMVPVGIVVAIAATIAGARLMWAWNRLGTALDAAANAAWLLLAPRRAQNPTPVPAIRRASTPSCLVLLWLGLAGLQMGLYLLQENLEVRALGLPAPGWGVFGGVHWAAPVIHLYVAFVLATAALIVERLLQRRHTAVARVTRFLRVLVERLARGTASRPWAPAHGRVLPRRRLPHALWTRPPPLARCARLPG